jgi:AcrR family transcriptional regulator
MARKRAPGTRDRILDNAGRLFREHGARAVGMQQIVDACGCGKNLVYREFASKDDLVAVYLDRCQQEWTATMDQATLADAGDPAAQLVAMVRAAVAQAESEDYRGCPFRSTLAQFPSEDHPAHRAAVRHADELWARLHALAERAGARDARSLADQLMLVFDGLYTNGAVLGPKGSVGAAVPLAQDIVRAATGR